jgi:hypothetical protein
MPTLVNVKVLLHMKMKPKLRRKHTVDEINGNTVVLDNFVIGFE